MLRKSIYLGVGLAGVVVSGCTVGPNYKPPQVHVNNAYGEMASATTGPTTGPTTQHSRPVARAIPLVEWWTTFHDPQLDALIGRAVESNLDLREATSRVLEARAQRAIVFGNALPQVDFNGQAAKFRVSQNGIPIPSGIGSRAGGGSAASSANGLGNVLSPQVARPKASSPGGSSGGGGGGSSSSSSGGGINSILAHHELDLYQLGFDASWEIDVFGGIRRGVEAANAELASSIEDRHDVLVSLLAEVARNYIDLRGFQRQQAIAEENLRTQQESLGLTQDKFKHGFATDLDVSRAAAEVATTASQIPALVNQQKQTIHALGLLLGQDPIALEAELSVSKPIPPVPSEVPIGVPAELLRRRPDIRRAERQLAAATARVGIATAELYPRFSLSGTFAFQSTKPKSLFDWNSRSFQIGPAIDWPIFNAGRLRAQVQVYGAREQQAEAAYEKTVLAALRDVENALTAYSTEQLRHDALVDAVKANTTAVDLANQQYRTGVADFLTVLDAQRNLFAAQDQLAQSDRTISTDLVALYKALGGGWEIEQRQQ
jgi:NodT family efflux transporter outer membrane factor (OMF) lipoprotein